MNRSWTHLIRPALAAGLVVASACSAGRMTHPLSCATDATPYLGVEAQFSVDTGIPESSAVGASYGQSSCPDAYLVQVALGLPHSRADFFVSGGWSTTIPAPPCDETATMTVFVLDGGLWEIWDIVAYAGQAEGALCHAQALSHTDARSAGLGGAVIPADTAVQTVRVAITATQGGLKAPIFLAGD